VTWSGVAWSEVLCTCNYNKIISHLMTYANMQNKFLSIKPTHAHLRYIAIQYLVYSCMFQQNSAILMESLHRYLTLTKVQHITIIIYYISVISPGEIKNTRSCKMRLIFCKLLHHCTFHYCIQTSTCTQRKSFLN